MLPRRSRAILDALGSDSLSGRQIAKRCGNRIAYGPLYSELRTLIERGLVAIVREGRDDIGPFRVFAATRTGRLALVEGETGAVRFT